MNIREPKKIALLVGGLVVLAIGLRYLLAQPERPVPTGKTIYYTGAMMNKSRTGYADDNGNVVPPPPGSAPADGTNPRAPGAVPGTENDAPKSDNAKTPAEMGNSTD